MQFKTPHPPTPNGAGESFRRRELARLRTFRGISIHTLSTQKRQQPTAPPSRRSVAPSISCPSLIKRHRAVNDLPRHRLGFFMTETTHAVGAEVLAPTLEPPPTPSWVAMMYTTGDGTWHENGRNGDKPGVVHTTTASQPSRYSRICLAKSDASTPGIERGGCYHRSMSGRPQNTTTKIRAACVLHPPSYHFLPIRRHETQHA